MLLNIMKTMIFPGDLSYIDGIDAERIRPKVNANENLTTTTTLHQAVPAKKKTGATLIAPAR